MQRRFIQSIIQPITTVVLLSTPVLLTAAGFPACVNNKITINGIDGPEIWSCVATSDGTQPATPDYPTKPSEIATADPQSIPDPKLVNRTEASSETMKAEISRVLEESDNVKKPKSRKHFSAGLQYSTNRKNKNLRDNRSRTVVFPLGIGFDITDRTSMTVNVPLISKQKEVVGAAGVINDDVVGVGDVSLNTTSRIFGETEKRPSVSLSFGVGAPTGEVEDPRISNKMSVGSGFWTLSAGATVSKRFDPATVFGSIRYQHVVGDKQFGYEIEPGGSLEYSYGLGFSLNNSLSLSGHIAGAIHRNTSVNGVEVDGSNSEPLELVTTSTLRLKKGSRLESNLSIGLNKDASDATFGLTLTKEF